MLTPVPCPDTRTLLKTRDIITGRRGIVGVPLRFFFRPARAGFRGRLAYGMPNFFGSKISKAFIYFTQLRDFAISPTGFP